MFNIVFYNKELSYQKYREEIFTKLPYYNTQKKYIYICISDYEDYEFKGDINKINLIILYPRQIKSIDTKKKIYNTIVNIPKTKIIFIDDVHTKYHHEFDVEYLNKFDIKIMTYKYLQLQVLPKLNSNNLITCRHYLHDKFISNINNRPIKISLIGHYRHPTYKMRTYIIKNNKIINKNLINCEITSFNKELTTDKYYDILTQSYTSIATTGDDSKYYRPYLVSKYFEIPGCGALLIAHILPELVEEMKECGFIENINYIKFTTVEELIEKCNYIFKPENKEEIERIRLNGYNLIINNHLISHRQKQIVNLFNNNQ